MPIYEYACEKCDSAFEALVASHADQPTCPQCGSTRLTKQFSVPAAHSGRSRELPICGQMLGAGCGRAECGSGHCPLD